MSARRPWRGVRREIQIQKTVSYFPHSCVIYPEHLPLFFMRKLLLAIIIAVLFGGGWGIAYFILG